MAKVRPGGLLGQLSGKVGSTVYSHNRYGSYIRALVKPVVSQTVYALAQKGHFAEASQLWRTLTEEQQIAWREWAQSNQITDRVGVKQSLDGHAAFVMLNARILSASGTPIDIPPVSAAPEAVTATFTYDIGAGDFEGTIGADPGAGNLFVYWAAVVSSEGINYAKNRLKLIDRVTYVNPGTFDMTAGIEARFGTLQEGQKVIIQYAVYDASTGLYSGFNTDSGVIVST